jgi:acyl carrier protein
MPDPTIFDKVAAIIRDVLRKPNLAVRPETRAPDVPGWDSFAMVRIIIAVQDAFGVELETDYLDEIDNVSDLVRAITVSLPSIPC